MNKKRITFVSKLGIVAAAAGSAVGLGNIWRFPSQAADGGGALFIFLYIGCILFFGIPLMMGEFLIGRSGRANPSGSFEKLAPETSWKWVGRLGILTAFLILGFYMVVCGWTLDYIIQSISGQLMTSEDFGNDFAVLQQNPVRQISWMFLFTALTAFFILAGVKKGIEQSAKILMPVLFFILLVLGVRSVTLIGAQEGLAFLFKPNMEHVKSTIFLDAIGQAFFSLSIGMGCMTTYGSYFRDDSNLRKTAIQVSLLDTMVAILAGIVIFPAAFALTQSPDTIVSTLVAGGPGLLFITIPDLFHQLPFSSLWATLFFVLLGIAALTSTISLMEVVASFLHEEFQMLRRNAIILVSMGVAFLGIISSISPNFFNILDYATAKIMLPLSGLFISLFIGWYLDRKITHEQLTNNGAISISVQFIKSYIFILRYVAPVVIVIIFVYGVLF
ncbi:MAG TPA: sodium-dependent transporter [Dysgonamonadaceae bacterium]|nr:sodium-dependent transporter [Dysgonamonadaceae bacterium]